MTRYSGDVGFVGESQESPPDSGVWVDPIVQRHYFGDVDRNTRRLVFGESINGNVSVGNSIRIHADGYALEHYLEIKYAFWNGHAWCVDDVEVARPRLVLMLGGLYNGPFPEEAPPP